MKQRPILVFLLICILSSHLLLAENVIESKWDTSGPIQTKAVPQADLASAQTYGFSLWFKYNYRLPDRVDLSQLVNKQTAIAGVTEGDNYFGNLDGDKALSASFLPFGTAGGPVIKFATYSTSKSEPVNLEIELDTDEIDG